MGNLPFKFAYSNESLTKPHFYDDPKFLERKFREFGVEGAINAIKAQFVDMNQQDKLDALTDNDLVERIYSGALSDAWHNIISIEAKSGKRMQGLMLNLVSDKPNMTYRVMGALQDTVHSGVMDKSDSSKKHGVTPVYSYCFFVPIEDIIGTVLRLKKMSVTDLFDKTEEYDAEDEIEPDNEINIVADIMAVCKGIIAENNPVCVTYCIDTVLMQEMEDRNSGKRIMRELKYSMNYSEFPNGKCVRSTYILLDKSMINREHPDSKGILEHNKDAKSVHVSVVDAIMGSNHNPKELLKNNPDFAQCIELFDHHSVMNQVRRLDKDKNSISSVADDVFMKEANKYEEINNYRFYLYETKDYMINELSNTNPETDIKSFLDSL